MSEIIEWYRPNPLSKLMRLGAWAGSIMICGVFVMALGYQASPMTFVKNSEAWIGWGMLLVVFGVSSVVYGVWRIHSKGETYLQVERKGLVYVFENASTAIAWQSISDIQVVNKRLHIYYESDKEIKIDPTFIGIDQDSLRVRLLEVKRNILLGIKRP